MSRVIIIGATSGIGRETAKVFLAKGWQIGIAGRRIEALEELAALSPGNFRIKQIDITADDAAENLFSLITDLGGLDVLLLCSGIGYQNIDLEEKPEIDTIRTNSEGFVRITTAAFRYFSKQKQGHIAVITSIAGTKGLGVAPAYSATKRFDSIYLDALEQLANLKSLKIHFTDIRPGFVHTALLSDGQKYPLQMSPEYVAKHIYNAIDKHRRVVVIDWRYSILVFFWKLIPRCIWKRLLIKTNPDI